MLIQVPKGRRAALVMGVRTPFQKQATGFAELSALELGVSATGELLARCQLPRQALDRVVFGQVLPSLLAPNVAREISLLAGLPRGVDAFSVSRACATSYQSAVSVTEAIWSGAIDCAVAGGTDSASDVPITVSRKLASALLRASKAKTVRDRIASFKGLRPTDLVPVAPAIRELSTGLSMGQSAEKMARENGISRERQDEFAHQSHVRAAEAWADGRLGPDVMTVYVKPDYAPVDRDNLVRQQSTPGDYARLTPAFDKKFGTVTAANSSALTDGAAALLIVSEDALERYGLSPLGFIRSYAFAAVDPSEQLLMGPAYATPLALDRAGLSLADLDLIDMHEAFAAQVLSNTDAMESQRFAEEKLGRSRPVGTIDWSRFNVSGGSIALGHPFAATGARQLLQTMRELRRRGGQFALCTACAAGGLGASIVLEAAE